MSYSARVVLEQSIENSQKLLLDYLNNPNISQDLSVAFGDMFNTDTGISLLQSLGENQTDSLPQIEIRSSDEINHAKATYSSTTNTIYFSEEFIVANADDPDKIVRVYLEEVGHYLDFQGNISDAPGDEGAIFSSLVTGEKLTEEKLTTLQAEDDTANIILDGTKIVVEQADAIIYVDINATGSNNGASWANAYTSLQDAIAASEATDQIWVAAGTYRPTAGTDRAISFVLPDGVQIYGGFAGGETSLEQRDVAANITELTGEIATQGNNTDNSYIVVDVSGTSNTSRLDGFTITDANNDQSFASPGGGIFASESFAILANLTISDNAAGNGGGIYATSSELQISNLLLSGNFATNDGGGLYSDRGNSTLNNITFVDNLADTEGGAVFNSNTNDVFTNAEFRSNRGRTGGAIYNDGDSEFIDSVFVNNTATDNGGAIHNTFGSNPSITNVDFVSNTAINTGGAIHNAGGSPVIIDAVFADNIANSSGGGIYSSGSSSTNYTVANSLFTGNISLSGGGIYSGNNSSTIVNNTFSDNIGRTGGAIFFEGDADDTPSITNSIVYDNRTFANDDQIAVGGTGLTATNSLIEGGFAGEGNIDADPQFVAPDSFDYRLNTGSPAIDTGNDEATVLFATDTAIPNIELTEDLADNPRIAGNAVDLGVYEGAALEPVPTLPTITSETNIVYVNLNATGENNGSSWANAYTDLQDALANAPFGSQIWVAAGTYTPTAESDRAVSFVLPNGIQLYGGFAGDEANLSERNIAANPTVLSGEIGRIGDNTDNSVTVVNISDTTNSSVLDGFTISDGNADDFSLSDDGGGIFGVRSQAILSNLIVTNNTATGSGGGMYSESSLNQITNVDFIANIARLGGGLYNSSSGSILNNVSFEANSSSSSGGAIYNQSSSIFINDAGFDGNLASGSGGAIYNDFNSDPIVDTAVFANNNSETNGGAIFNDGSSPVLTSVEFRDNNAVSSGGAVYNNGRNADGRIASGIFEGNTAEFGGAVYNNSSNNRGINLTFANNTATESGGAVYSAGNTDSTPTYNNSIFSGNTGSSDSEPIFNDGANTIVSQSIVEGGYEGLDVTDADPLFVDREAGDLRLLAGSPGIDTGTLEPVFEETDVIGSDRVFGAGIDLGAYEYFAPALEISDVSVTADSETAEFVVSLVDSSSQPFSSTETVTVNYETIARSAIAGTDFEATTGTVTFEPGETEQPVAIPVTPNADNLERNVNFSVALRNPTNAEVIDTFGFAIFGAAPETPDTSTPDNSTPDGSTTNDTEAPTVFRFFRPEVGVHFYTASEAERDSILENLPEFTFEGASFVAAPTPAEQDSLTGAEPVYRFLNNNTGVHVYTISEEERDAILELPNFTDEGISYYGYETPQEGTIPLYRFYNPIIDAHFYTPNAGERDFVNENLTDYQPEGEGGIAYYVQPLGDLV